MATRPELRGVMAGLGGLPGEFGAAGESFGAYSRWLEQYLLANDVSEDQPAKRRAIFLSVIGAKTFALLEDLVAPEKVVTL